MSFSLEEKKEFAAALAATPAELELESEFISKGIKYVKNAVIRGWIPDFYLSDYNLIVEVNGSVHTTRAVAEKDMSKRKDFLSHGYKFISVTNRQIRKDKYGVMKAIRDAGLGRKYALPSTIPFKKKGKHKKR